MTISHDAQLILLGAFISLVSSLITALVNHYLSLHADKVKRARDKDSSLNSIIVPTSSTLPDLVDRNKLQIRNVTGYSYGISFVGKIVYNAVYKSDSVPVKRSISLFSQDNVEKEVELLIWRNLSNDATVEEGECEQIGTLNLVLPSALTIGSPLKITFRLDEEGSLNVSAEDPSSLMTTSVNIETSRKVVAKSKTAVVP